MTRLPFAIALAAIMTLEPGLPAAAAEQCFDANALASRPDEFKPIKGVRAYDEPAAPRKLVPAAPVAQALRGAIRRVKLPAGSAKLIALTFDLCEQPGELAGYDGAIFDYLRAQGVKATLFTGGKWMRSHAVRMQQLMTDPRFEIANHSEAHRNLRLLDTGALREEILGPQRSYEAARAGLAASKCFAKAPDALARIPARMGLFRFPFGACNAQDLEAVNGAGLLAIQWDLSTGDPSPGQSAEAIASAMLKAKPGSILIAHANGRGYHTAAALPLAIPQLKAKGFEFVTVSELLAAGTPEIVQTCYDNRPGDSDKYDKLFPLHGKEPKPPEPAINVPRLEPDATVPR